jgi:LemA protein
MTLAYILIGLIVIAIFFIISLYNGLVTKRSMMQEGWSGIDVSLKKRYDLIPNLVNTVKGYATHEKQLLEEVTSLRTRALQSTSVEQKIGIEKELGPALGKLMVSVENYPDLKASENFRDLQGRLSEIETELEMSRRYYNGTVRENNIAIESFPGNVVAGMFKFEKGTFFEIDNSAQRENPSVSF